MRTNLRAQFKKRLMPAVVALAVLASATLGALALPHRADAQVRVFHAGEAFMICYYDSSSGMLAFCEIYHP